jgi:hypothetical protein
MTLKTGKAEYPLPMFVNAWLRQGKDKPGEDVPGGYPSGGPLPQVLDAWRAGGPAIDILAPDVHVPNYAEWCAWYTRPSPPRRLQLFHGVRCPRGRPASHRIGTDSAFRAIGRWLKLDFTHPCSYLPIHGRWGIRGCNERVRVAETKGRSTPIQDFIRCAGIRISLY